MTLSVAVQTTDTLQFVRFWECHRSTYTQYIKQKINKKTKLNKIPYTAYTSNEQSKQTESYFTYLYNYHIM